MPIRHFLIIFDSEKQELIAARDVGIDRREAMEQYVASEQDYGMPRGRIQIVLLGAESLETVKQTHSQYFAPFIEDPFADLAHA